MSKFQKIKKNTNKNNKSHKKFKKFNSKTPSSNPNKRGFQKKIRHTKLKDKDKIKERSDDISKDIEEFSKENTQETVIKDIKPETDNEKEGGFNDKDFYFDDADNVNDEPENLDFGEEDYVESDEDSQIGQEDEEKVEKILTKREFKRIYLQATKGKPYALTKLVRIFAKLVNPDLKFDFVENENIMNNHKFYKKMIKIAIKVLPDLFNAKISSFQNKTDIPGSIKQLIKRFLTKYSYFISFTEKGLFNFIFKYIHKITDLVLLFKNSVPVFFKISLKIWSESIGTRASDNAFSFVTSIVEKNNSTFGEALKYCYLNYLNSAKAMNLTSFQNIIHLQEKIVGLLSSNYEQSYIIIFKFIRKLCLQLRSTINDKKKNSIKNIYNWQFVNSLSLWTKCVLEYYNRKDADINLLAYPLVQLIIGTIRLNFVDTFFCMRINLVSLLNEISQKTNIFIPVGNYILEILESNVFTRKFSDFKENNIDIFLLIKLKPENYNNYNIVRSVFQESLTKLTEYLAINSNKVLFPEFSVLIIHRLRKLMKNIIDKNLKAEVKSLLDKINIHIELVKEYRKKSNVIIKDTGKLKDHEVNLLQGNSLIEEIEKIKIKQKDYIESRVSQIKGEFISI